MFELSIVELFVLYFITILSYVCIGVVTSRFMTWPLFEKLFSYVNFVLFTIISICILAKIIF